MKAYGTHLLTLVTASSMLALTVVGAENGLLAQNQRMFQRLQEVHGLSDAQMQAVKAIFARSGFAGQGNPRVARHPMTPVECEERLDKAGVDYRDERFERICGGPYMAPLYDPGHEKPEDARVCIDRLEFPDIPCEYPVVWIRAREAEESCLALGKRMCDAHEWEGACAGRLLPEDYRFDLARGVAPATAVARMRNAHNEAQKGHEVWAYGPRYRRGVCATGSRKTPGCAGGGWTKCGSNTYPAGAFPACQSPLGVLDLHGNAAEHMNLPLRPEQMASRGTELGYTEMKGSWFIFDGYRAHEDWCRWRAPYWHGSRVMDPSSHENYHLGFRCCKDLER